MTYEQDEQNAKSFTNIVGVLSNIDKSLGRIAEAATFIAEHHVAEAPEPDTFMTGDGKRVGVDIQQRMQRVVGTEAYRNPEHRRPFTPASLVRGEHGPGPDVAPKSARDCLVRLDPDDEGPDAIIVRTHDGRELNLEQLLEEHHRLRTSHYVAETAYVRTDDDRRMTVAELLLENRNLRRAQQKQDG